MRGHLYVFHQNNFLFTFSEMRRTWLGYVMNKNMILRKIQTQQFVYGYIFEVKTNELLN